MLIGINYPWIDYGWDFSDPPQAWVPGHEVPSWREKKRIHIEEDFRFFAAHGILAVRWFLLADGLNYGLDEFAPRLNGKSWTFDPLPENHPYYRTFLEDFEFVLTVCRKTGLKLFPSLIDFHWCQEGTALPGAGGIIKGGRYDIVRDATKRDAFFERILDPCLEISVQFPDSIFAWELINEPEWAVRKFSIFGRHDANRTLSKNEMKEFIREGMRRINTKGPRSSVGFAHWDTLNRWDAEELGITVQQFHYYAQKNCNLPECPGSASQSRVVGEFATASEMYWPDLKAEDQTIGNRLRCIEHKGYSACFMWSARAADAATRWTDAEHRDLIAHTRRQSPEFRV